jgi:hypothetical protein
MDKVQRTVLSADDPLSGMMAISSSDAARAAFDAPPPAFDAPPPPPPPPIIPVEDVAGEAANAGEGGLLAMRDLVRCPEYSCFLRRLGSAAVVEGRFGGIDCFLRGSSEYRH